MIALIPLVKNDYVLALLYLVVIVFSLRIIDFTRTDVLALFFGFVMMTVFEYIFIATGVETFARNSLFGIMPFWLPFLWAYGFVAIKRSVETLNHKIS